METKEITRESKINRIYEVIADKTLSFGCKVEGYIYTRGCLEGHPCTYDCSYMDLSCCGEKRVKKSWTINRKALGLYVSEGKNYLKYDSYESLDMKSITTETEYALVKAVEYFEEKFFKKKYGIITKIIGHPVLRGDVDAYVDKNCFWINKEDGQERDMPVLRSYWTKMHYGLMGFHNKPVDERPMEMIDYVYSLIVGNE